MKSEIIKEMFEIKNENKKLKEKVSALMLDYKSKDRLFKNSVNKEVKIRVKEIEENYKKEIEKYEYIVKDKDNQIEALKKELAKAHSLLDNNSYNSGIPTSKTKIGERKYIPNTREKTDKKVGGQEGHSKHKLKKFEESEATKIVEMW